MKHSYCPLTGHLFVAGEKQTYSVGSHGYYQISIDGRMLLLHRYILTLQGVPIGEQQNVDHINGDKTDNRWCNLRVVSFSENSQNRAGKGAYFDKRRGRWESKLRLPKEEGEARGRSVFLGYFDTADEASAAYLAAKQKYHPAFARSLNYVKDKYL